MSIAKVIGSNIEKVKEKYGLSNEKLGDLLGVTRQTVGKYISGEQVIDSAKLFRLASYCNLPFKFFLTDSDAGLSFMFRADNPAKTFDQGKAERINQKLLSYCELARSQASVEEIFIPESHKLIPSGDKKLTKEEIEKIKEIAENVRKSIELDDVDIYKVLENKGIVVYAMELSEELDALSAFSDDHGAFIVINDRDEIPEERKRFSCAHELGHLILHRDDYRRSTEELQYTTSRTDIREKMANHFASFLLMPRDALNKEYRRVLGKRWKLEMSDVMRMKHRFGVSAQALLLALKDEGFIEAKTYGFLSNQIKSLYGTNEPVPMPRIEKNKQLYDLLRNLVKEEAVTTNKVADLLDMSITDARLLVKSWAEESEPIEVL